MNLVPHGKEPGHAPGPNLCPRSRELDVDRRGDRSRRRRQDQHAVGEVHRLVDIVRHVDDRHKPILRPRVDGEQDVLELDEPFASVDALTRAELQDVLLAVHAPAENRRVTIVHVTHDIDEAVYLADRVLVLAPSPGTVAASIEVGLARPRTQTATRSSPRFLAVRNEVHDVIVQGRR